MRKVILSAAVAAFACGAAMGQIQVGPWTFDNDAFADDATQLENGSLTLWGGAQNLDDALTGYSPVKQIVNIGFSGNANLFQLDFLDVIAVNASGEDIVFFDARFSADPYEIAVRPQGGNFTNFRAYGTNAFLDTGVNGSARIWGLPIELTDFGLGNGVRVDAIRFRALPNQGGNIEGDPVMAAVLNIPAPGAGAAALLGAATLLRRRR